ncbi:MAG TPA: VOC family protein [Micropepsaceae bacterium]|nr:VOC family protein [Micropepsaceae bacterium]
MAIDSASIKSHKRPEKLPFGIVKLGHVVLNCANVERSVRFYTEILGLEVSDVYPDEMVAGGMVFMRFNEDHHGVALVGSMKGPSPNVELNHLAFEVATLDEVILARNHLKKHGVRIDFEGRRRAGVQIAVEFRDPDGHRLEIYWGLDRVKADGYIRPASEWKLARTLKDAIADPVRGQDTRLKDPSILDEAVEAKTEMTSGGSSRW